MFCCWPQRRATFRRSRDEVNPEHATIETIAAAIRLVNRVRQDRPQVDRAHAIIVSGLAPYRGRRLEGVERAKASSATAQLLQGAPTRGLAAGMPEVVG